MSKLSTDLKEAILRMPAAEKDKLLRLVAKDAKNGTITAYVKTNKDKMGEIALTLYLLNPLNLLYILPC